MVRSIAMQFVQVWGFVQDAATLGRLRRLAEQVDLLSRLVTDRGAGVAPPAKARRLAESLGDASRALHRALEARRRDDDPVPASPPPALHEADPAPSNASPATWPLAAATNATIALCDWLARVREDERIPAARAAQIEARKCAALLEALGITRIERTGAFDATDQQIVESVSTDSEGSHMRICDTVSCGYRTRDRLIRPQKVTVFSYAPRGDRNGMGQQR